jgi:hypothetical protein
MLIALLAVLGVDLIVIVVLLGAVLSRRRWVSHQSGAFKGASRVVKGEVPGLSAKWKQGYGRWVGETFVWTKAPLLFRNEVVAVSGPAGEVRRAKPGEMNRLGSEPVVVSLQTEGAARLEIAAPKESRGRLLGPFATSVGGNGDRTG